MLSALRSLIDERDSLTNAYSAGYVAEDVYHREMHILNQTISSIYRKA